MASLQTLLVLPTHAGAGATPFAPASLKYAKLNRRVQAASGTGRVVATVGKASRESSEAKSVSNAEDHSLLSEGVQITTSPSPRNSPRSADSTDWIASAVTRRFGLGAGLAWVGFLAFGVVSEQLKTRREVYLEETLTREVDAQEEVTLPNGARYVDFRLGGGASPRVGDLMVLSLVGTVLGAEEPFLDTTAPGKRDLVMTFGARPYREPLSEGLVLGLESMRAGGRRQIVVPPELGYGETDVRFGGETGPLVPGGSTLVYVAELKRVSISPS